MKDGNEYFRWFLDGDASAFEEIIKMYRENLIFFTMRYINSVSIAEEIAEDAFVELFIHKDRYNFSCSLKTYLFTIARNKAINYLRKNSKNVEYEEYFEDKEDERSLEEDVIKTDEARMLYKVLDMLPSDYRTALYLVYIEDMSYSQAGVVMKKNTKQIENLVFRAKKSAKALLEKEGMIRHEN